jgi:hypothetical protein
VAKQEFFFEKKNQKTFENWYGGAGWRACHVAKIFCFFFQKEALSTPERAASRS